ncbi:hypothetical protein GCM10027418_09770 [Mariniluteicoccus endophyticus]
MSETYSVAEMRAHHQSLQTVDSKTQALVGEANGLGFGDWKMYGLFASPILCPILAIGNAANTGAIKELGRVSTTATEAFKTTADLYDAAEQSNVDLSKVILEQIEDTGRRTR